jgi:hypothetical protein
MIRDLITKIAVAFCGMVATISPHLRAAELWALVPTYNLSCHRE